MFKKLPGDEAQHLVATNPDTAVVFRPAVLRTPAIVTIVIFTWRLMAGVVRLVWRHPIASAVVAAPGPGSEVIRDLGLFVFERVTGIEPALSAWEVFQDHAA
ncbi:hypothetical protein AB0B54_33925 [Microbispora bryophytorum]|uniref:hypothetical protein n=1 Tax=Microbispora bryophytorum TaxID=1460882 RepID=UPI00340627B7